MAKVDSDRNLLFGILALQMDFISRDALIRAMSAWAVEKTQPLGQILVQQGALREDARALLEPLVRKHLEMHDNDAEKSLVAVGTVSAVCEDLQHVTDADVHASLKPFAHDSPTADQFVTRAPSVGTPSSSGLRFRILRPYARGGLGEVFVAEDQELHREVALKEIQDRHADDPQSRARFMLEAEVTGGLEHPCIVPVYGLGTYPDGRPFYAMRFIRGDSLKDGIERYHKHSGIRGEKSVEFRKLLDSFVDVCNAIEYAHSRGVLHRDLKPGNIMLGKYGETIVVDWGLAKPRGAIEENARSEERLLQPSAISGTMETVAGAAVGTPQFMSPEQAIGRLEMLGPASDVYSLGATLFAVLTGKPPFAGLDVGDVLKKVQCGDFPRPRQVLAGVAPALEAICLKAMALKPADRYASARALADDVDHWLADEPVAAYPEPLGARLNRWGRRHRSLVVGAAALLVTAVAALTVSTVLISREQSRTLVERRRAEENFHTALQAVNDMLTEVAEDQLANEPRMEKKRRALLVKAKNYYEQFLQERSNDPKLRKETALAYQRLADISRLLGDYEPARAEYAKAIDLLASLVNSSPDDPELRRALADSYSNLGEVQRTTGKSAAAQEAYEQALKLQERLVAEFADKPLYRQDLARTQYNLGILFKDTERPQLAEKALRDAAAVLSQLVTQHPKEPTYQQHLARAYLNLGPVLRASGRAKDAEDTYREAIRLQAGLVAKDGLNPAYRCELAVTDNNLGFLLESMKRHAEAAKAHQDAVDLLSELVVQFPSVPVYQKELANSRNNLAIVLARTGEWKTAEKNWRQALTIFEKLWAEAPDVPDYEAGVGMVLGNLGWLALQQKEPAKARLSLEEGIKRLKRVLLANPDTTLYHRLLREQYGYLIDAFEQLGEKTEAAEARKQLAELESRKQPPKP
ncbi:MAG: tetratricopeptide repeat protein [Gemmataceae bacterium]|nr:tetratricopeptide repeat protein [Gemmataceae bacterium]